LISEEELKKTPNKKAIFQVTISVPKRNFKKAHDRNRIKRLIREAIRKNKLILEEPLKKKNQHVALFLIYKHNAVLDFKSINQKTEIIFNLLNQKIYDIK
jgi:ribonuclease P protein component